MTRYILICRHGPHRGGVLTTVMSDGDKVYPTDAIGKRLREQLEAMFPFQGVPLEAIWCADSKEAKATLGRLMKTLRFTCNGDMTSAVSRKGSTASITFMKALAPPMSIRPGVEGKLAKEL